MFFSIIMPVYNVEKYLKESVESVLRQTYQDFELILINDGSTDTSGEICDYYQTEYKSKIKVIHQENRGTFFARKKGFDCANGSYVWTVDSDDIVNHNTLMYVKNSIERTKADMLFFDMSTAGDTATSIYNYPFADLDVFEKHTKKEIYSVVLEGKFPSLANKIFRADFIKEKTDHTLNENINMSEDLLQILPIITSAKKIVYLDKKLYYYRRNEGSVTRAFNKSFYYSMRTVAQKLHEYIDIWELENPEQRKKDWSLHVVYFAVVKLVYADIIKDWTSLSKYLLEISNDDFFLKAYESQEMSRLDKKKKLTFKLLYKKRIMILLLFVFIYSKIKIILTRK